MEWDSHIHVKGQQKTGISRWGNGQSWVFSTSKNVRAYFIIHNPLRIIMQLLTCFLNVCCPLVNKEWGEFGEPLVVFPACEDC